MEAVVTWSNPGPAGTSGAGPAAADSAGRWRGSFLGFDRHTREKSLGPDMLDPESQLVERCLLGEDAAWEELVRTHTRRVYGICFRFTGSDAEAQDLIQDVFLRLFRSLGSFRAREGSFTVWLARMARNLLIDHYRKSKLQRASDSMEERLSVLEASGSPSTRADAILAGREAGELIQQALARLSPELREAVILRDLEELEYREIAGVLSIPEGTVKSRLNRGRAELARLLRKQRVTA